MARQVNAWRVHFNILKHKEYIMKKYSSKQGSQLIKTANGYKFQISQDEWKRIGKQDGWLKSASNFDDFTVIESEPGELPPGKVIAVDYLFPDGREGDRTGPFKSYESAKGWTELNAFSHNQRDTDGYWVIIADESTIQDSPDRFTGDGYIYEEKENKGNW